MRVITKNLDGHCRKKVKVYADKDTIVVIWFIYQSGVCPEWKISGISPMSLSGVVVGGEEYIVEYDKNLVEPKIFRGSGCGDQYRMPTVKVKDLEMLDMFLDELADLPEYVNGRRGTLEKSTLHGILVSQNTYKYVQL